MTNYDLDKPGWYLLASQHNKSCYDIFNNYSHPVSLDISCVYIPLLDDSSINTLIDLDNSNSITHISNLQNLSFGTNIGVCVPDYYSTKPYLYGKISDLSQTFTVKPIGIWMNLYEKTVDPVFNIQINQITQNSNPLFLKHDSNPFTSPLDLSFTTDNSFSLTLQRRYNFRLIDISYSVDSTTSNITTFSQNPSDTNENYIDLSGFNNDRLNTDVSGNVGFIKYTIMNATTTPDTSFNVTINLFVEDTIFPTIRFTNDYNNSNLSNIYTLNNNASNLNFSGETNATTIRINQTTIRDNLNINFTPIPIAYDQDNTAFTISPVDPSYIPSTITYYEGSLSNTENISYSTGEWRAGTYKIRYEVSDGYGNTTNVDVSFEIMDDINPVLTISNNLQNSGNNFSVYFSNGNLSLNSDYNIFSNTDISSGIGVFFDNLSTFNTDISTNSDKNVNFYIRYTDISQNNVWNFPTISEATDFSDIDVSDMATKSNINGITTITEISNVLYDINHLYYEEGTRNNYLQREYKAIDYANNSSNLTANIRIVDDTIPVVDVSYIHTLFKINTSTGSSDILGIPQQIFDNSSVLNDNSSIVINLYDDIKFDFSMNKPCKCRIDISKNGSIPGPSIEPPAHNYSRNQTITLNQTHTDVSGLNQLYFTIYDQNNNYLKFKYDLSINDIPQYTLKMYRDTTDNKQKLLLRAVGSPKYNDKYFAGLGIKTNIASWNNGFSEFTTMYHNQNSNLNFFDMTISDGKYEIITTSGNTDPNSNLEQSQNGDISITINSGNTSLIQTQNTNNNTYYEFLTLPFDPILDISSVYYFQVGNIQTTTGQAINQENQNYNNIYRTVGFYKNNYNNIFYSN